MNMLEREENADFVMKPTEIMTATFGKNACKENTRSLLRQCKEKCEIIVYQGFRRNMGKERLVQDEILTISTGYTCERFIAADNNPVRIR
jgi:hypothetical protein